MSTDDIMQGSSNELYITDQETGAISVTKTVEAHILLAILEELEKINRKIEDC